MRRHTILDLYESSGRHDVRGLAEALVLPLSAKLAESVSGAGYLRVVSDLLNRPEPEPISWDADLPEGSMVRWRDLLIPHLDPRAVELHRRFHTTRFVVTELALRARAARTDHELFNSQLVDLVVGLLTAEVSSGTREVLARRLVK